MERKNAVIVAFGRSAIAKAIKGSLRLTGCVDFGSQVVILEPQNIKSLTVSIVSPSICHEVMGLDVMILVFEC